MSEEWKRSVSLFYCSLNLERKAVGIKLIPTAFGFEELEASRFDRPINYCQMVALASKGRCLKAKSENFACRSGARVLGIDPSDPQNAHGENWARLGLYENAELSREIREELVYSTEQQFGVYLAPIENFDDTPDIVQVAVNPFNCMRIVQGYAYHYGMPKAVNMIGNQAICLECTARPYVLKDMNVSVLCIGTRHRSGWKDYEMAVGMPGERFEKVADGLLQTVNAMESDKNKTVIEEKLAEADIPYDIRYHYNYYMEC